MDDGMAALFHGEWLKNKCGVEKNTEMRPTSGRRPRREYRTEVAHKKMQKKKRKGRVGNIGAPQTLTRLGVEWSGVSGVIIIVSK